MFISRSEVAIVRTSEQYGAYLTKICMNILNIKEDADECVNDTYLTAWKQIPPDRPQKFLPYLGKIAKNLSLNRYDYLKANKRNTHFDVLLSELEECLSSTNNTENSIMQKELSASISSFLRSIDEKSRNIFIRRYWYSDSIADVAKMFGISQSNAKVALYRIRNNLKKYLEKEEGYSV
nr:sigma-70 family RNA polymerase sigma factor [Paenibacillus sp. F411]